MSQGEPSLVTHQSMIGFYSKGPFFCLYNITVVKLSAPSCISLTVYPHFTGSDHDLCLDSGLCDSGKFECLSEFYEFIPDPDLFFHFLIFFPYKNPCIKTIRRSYFSGYNHQSIVIKFTGRIR